MSKFNVKFHGVRGSIPSPLGNEELEAKMVRAFQAAEPENLANDDSIKSFVKSLPHEVRGTFGGNSSCVSMQIGDEWLIFDAGSGIRMLGQDLMATEFGRGQGKSILFAYSLGSYFGNPIFCAFLYQGQSVYSS
jgi:hypothetical protein